MRLSLLCAALLLAPLTSLEAQQPVHEGWALRVGPRVGVELESSSFLAGGHARVHLPWPGFVDLQGSSSWTFFDGLTERQINADVLVRVAGVAVGGGPVWLHTIFDTGEPKRTETGWSFVVILGGMPDMGGLFSPAIELRITDVDRFSPRQASIGFGVPIRF